MDKKRGWNGSFTITYNERRRRDPLYQFNYDILYTQMVTNGLIADIEEQPIKADKDGVFHVTSL